MMITKELFVKYIKQYQTFNHAFERIEEALMGKKYTSNLYESDWVYSVGCMLDIFIQSHFTDSGCDLITWWLFESVPKIIYQDDLKISVETLDELWEYMINNKEDYFA